MLENYPILPAIPWTSPYSRSTAVDKSAMNAPVEIIVSGSIWCKANLRLLTFFVAAADFH
jgi:hypothetical protein